MLFLRFVLLLIFALGLLVYLTAIKLRSEFFKTSGMTQPLFRGHSAEFEAFCKTPPTEKISTLLQLKKNLSIALMIAIFGFLLAVLSVAI